MTFVWSYPVPTFLPALDLLPMPANLKPNLANLNKLSKTAEQARHMACSNKKAPPQSTPTPFVQPGQNPELI